MTNNTCYKTGKIKLDKISAMISLANSQLLQKHFKFKCRRKETRFYFCKYCKMYHLTSQNNKLI